MISIKIKIMLLVEIWIVFNSIENFETVTMVISWGQHVSNPFPD